MPQMHLGVDIANSWLPSGRSSVRNTKTALTPLWPRWTPQPTRSKRLKSIASPRLNSSPQEMSARWVFLEDQADKRQHMCVVLNWILHHCLPPVSTVHRNPGSLAFSTRSAGVWFFWIPRWWPHACIKCAQPAAAPRRSSFWATGSHASRLKWAAYTVSIV